MSPNPDTITIRSALLADAPAIAELTHRAFASQCEFYGVANLPPKE